MDVGFTGNIIGKVMAHTEQITFCNHVKSMYPHLFTHANVIDVGSSDVNGNNRYLFTDCTYQGVDIVLGKNVDTTCPIHELQTDVLFDVVVSTEMLEHDVYWDKSLMAMYNLLKPNGLLLITCATTDRAEHGTYLHDPSSSPGTNGYYKNISLDMFESILHRDMFSVYCLHEHVAHHDLQFYGIKI